MAEALRTSTERAVRAPACISWKRRAARVGRVEVLVSRATIDPSGARVTIHVGGRCMPGRDSKPAIDVPKKAFFTIGDGQRYAGWIVRLSLVGLVLEAPEPPPLDAQVLIVSELWDGEGDLVLRGRVQWSSAMRFAVQLGPLGAKETSAIVRFNRRSAA